MIRLLLMTTGVSVYQFNPISHGYYVCDFFKNFCCLSHVWRNCQCFHLLQISRLLGLSRSLRFSRLSCLSRFQTLLMFLYFSLLTSLSRLLRFYSYHVLHISRSHDLCRYTYRYQFVFLLYFGTRRARCFIIDRRE